MLIRPLIFVRHCLATLSDRHLAHTLFRSLEAFSETDVKYMENYVAHHMETHVSLEPPLYVVLQKPECRETPVTKYRFCSSQRLREPLGIFETEVRIVRFCMIFAI